MNRLEGYATKRIQGFGVRFGNRPRNLHLGVEIFMFSPSRGSFYTDWNFTFFPIDGLCEKPMSLQGCRVIYTWVRQIHIRSRIALHLMDRRWLLFFDHGKPMSGSMPELLSIFICIGTHG